MPLEASILVTTYNRRALLAACLESLAHQTVPADRFEVVVVVDGSTDGTSEMLAGLHTPYRLVVVEQRNAGQAAALNAGAARAEGRTLILMDDDEEASPGYVAAHLEAHRSGTPVAGVGPILWRVASDTDRFMRLRADEVRAHNDDLAARPLTYLDCYGGNSSVSRATYHEVGGYSEDLAKDSDFEFAYRLHRAGVDFRFLPDAVTVEFQTGDWRHILDEHELYGRAAVEVYRRHPEMIVRMGLGGFEDRSRRWLAFRAAVVSTRIPPRLLARLGFLAPRDAWASVWFRFAEGCAYWHGVRAASDRRFWRTARRGTPILMYHAFGGDRERASRFVIPARRFRIQMWWLRKRRYNVLSLEEYAAYRSAHRFPPVKSVVITIDDGYLDADTVARPVLEELGFPATVFLVTSRARAGAHGDSGLAERPVIDLDHARALSGGPIRFGAHTRTHPDLAGVEQSALQEEIRGSKGDLEQALGSPVTTFAYPYGSVTPEAREAVRAAGFSLACGVRAGCNRPATDSYDLRRTEIRGTHGLLRFAVTLLLETLT